MQGAQLLDLAGVSGEAPAHSAYTLAVLFSKALRLWLNQQLQARGITPAEVARRMRTSQSTINPFLNGSRHSITLKTLDRIFSAVHEIAAERAALEAGELTLFDEHLGPAVEERIRAVVREEMHQEFQSQKGPFTRHGGRGKPSGSIAQKKTAG